ncbi:MAG TPA: diacylglycerol kinase family protein [Thermoanaerobaculia bacterium]|nr:diacylglycerol kinase family protein [Thermoanaerobaculia bacterium]
MTTCIIVNPNAGSGETIDELRERLEGLPGTSVALTEKEGDAERIAREAVRSGADLVVAAGGDGTLNEVVNGLAEDFGRARLGLIPLGTGNDFARTINVPADLDASLAILKEGRTRATDVGRATFGGKCRYFINMAVGGFSPIVSEKADEAKERWGPLAYLRGAIGALPELSGFKTTLLFDDGERMEVEAYNIVLSNGRFVAAGIPVAPRSILDDGLLDVLIAPVTTVPQLAILVPQILLGRHLESDLLVFRQTARIEIVSDPPMMWNVDGEIIGDQPARFEVLPRVLQVVVGPEEEPPG